MVDDAIWRMQRASLNDTSACSAHFSTSADPRAVCFCRRGSRRDSIKSAKGHKFGELSGVVIGACIAVQRALGRHCMEIDYQRGLELALKARGLDYDREVEIPIVYEGVVVTRRRVDFVISCGEEELLLETKAASTIRPEDLEQCLLYLKQSGYRLGLLVNFGEKPLGLRRFVNSNGSRGPVASS